MRCPRPCRCFHGPAFAGILLATVTLRAQQPPPAEPAMPSAIEEVQTVQKAGESCVQPPPPVRWQDYTGPLHKVMGIFAQKIDRESVHPPHSPNYKPNTVLCSLKMKDKFILFARES